MLFLFGDDSNSMYLDESWQDRICEPKKVILAREYLDEINRSDFASVDSPIIRKRSNGGRSVEL